MKLRITQPGFEGYTAQLGVHNFVDGLSTTDVRVMDAVRMSAVMRCEWEDGSSPSVTQSLLDNAHTPAKTLIEQKAEDQANADKAPPAAAGPTQPEAPKHTRESLAAIADKDGIKGLRAIGDELGIKGNSIKDLMEAILKSGK